MKKMPRLGRLVAATAVCLMPGAAIFPLATTACGGCECVWEGGQTFHLSSASRDGTTIYLELGVVGQPCCESEWEETELVSVALAGYTQGALVGHLADDLAGTPLTVSAAQRVDLTDLGVAIQPNAEDNASVLDTTAHPLQVVSIATGEVLGTISVPAGSAIH